MSNKPKQEPEKPKDKNEAKSESEVLNWSQKITDQHITVSRVREMEEQVDRPVKKKKGDE